MVVVVVVVVVVVMVGYLEHSFSWRAPSCVSRGRRICITVQLHAVCNLLLGETVVSPCRCP